MKLKCPCCNRENVLHSLSHRKKVFGDDPDFRIKYIAYNIPDAMNKDLFVQKYVNENWSIPMICNMLGGLDIKNVCHILNYHNIKIRTIKETRSLSEYKERIESTNMEKFGAINPLSKGTTVFEKRNETVRKKYGVDNVFQCMNNFNIKHTTSRYSPISSLNRKVSQFLLDEHIKFTQEFNIKYLKDGKIQTRVYDIQIGNLLIELNGTYWHADPRYHQKDDILNFPKITYTAEELWNRDEFKKNLAIAKGFDFLVLWETEIKKDFENVKRIIKNKINHQD